MGVIYTLSDKKIEGATPLSLIKQNYLRPAIDLGPFDTLLITSKNAVKALNAITPTWQQKQIYTFGKETFKLLSKMGANNPILIEAKTGDDFALALHEELLHKHVLYPRAKVVHSNIKDILEQHGIDITEVVVYETVCASVHTKPIELEKNSTIIFSSPSTVRCFFENYDWDPSFRAVCIGEKTAKFLPEQIDAIISKANALKECVKTARGLQCS